MKDSHKIMVLENMLDMFLIKRRIGRIDLAKKYDRYLYIKDK